MNSKPLACDPGLLRQSLDDSLSELQEDELVRHLSECSACQRELERLAAEQAEWSRVGEILKQEAQSRRRAESSGRSGPDDASSQTTDWDFGSDSRFDSAVDFAVDFLDPSATPRTLGRLGDIDIEEVIGHGGMGVVLKGFQQELKRPVAVKVLAPHLATSGAASQIAEVSNQTFVSPRSADRPPALGA